MIHQMCLLSIQSLSLLYNYTPTLLYTLFLWTIISRPVAREQSPKVMSQQVINPAMTHQLLQLLWPLVPGKASFTKAKTLLFQVLNSQKYIGTLYVTVVLV